jgi:hypothetical protein
MYREVAQLMPFRCRLAWYEPVKDFSRVNIKGEQGRLSKLLLRYVTPLCKSSRAHPEAAALHIHSHAKNAPQTVLRISKNPRTPCAINLSDTALMHTPYEEALSCVIVGDALWNKGGMVKDECGVRRADGLSIIRNLSENLLELLGRTQALKIRVVLRLCDEPHRGVISQCSQCLFRLLRARMASSEIIQESRMLGAQRVGGLYLVPEGLIVFGLVCGKGILNEGSGLDDGTRLRLKG